MSKSQSSRYTSTCSDVFATLLCDSGKCVADVVIALDTSISVGWSDLEHIRTFLSKLVDHVINNLDMETGRIPVGLLTYSSTVRPLFDLSLYTTVAPIQAAISSFTFSRGATDTAAALAYVRTMMLTSLAGARDHVQKIVIVLTDGKSKDPEATKVHKHTHNLCVHFFEP